MNILSTDRPAEYKDLVLSGKDAKDADRRKPAPRGPAQEYQNFVLSGARTTAPDGNGKSRVDSVGRAGPSWQELLAQGYVFSSQTPAHMAQEAIASCRRQGLNAKFSPFAYYDSDPKNGRRIDGYVAIFVRPSEENADLDTDNAKALRAWYGRKLREQMAQFGLAPAALPPQAPADTAPVESPQASAGAADVESPPSAPRGSNGKSRREETL